MLTPSILTAVKKELDDLKHKHPEISAKVDAVEAFLTSFKNNLSCETPNFLQHLGHKPGEVMQRLVDPKHPNQTLQLIENHIIQLIDLCTELQQVLNWSK